MTLWDSDTAEPQDSFSLASSVRLSAGAGSGLLALVFLLVLRRLTFDADAAREHDSTSDTSSSSWLAVRGCLLLPLVRVFGISMSDTAEQQDSTSDTSPSCVEPTGVHGCSGLWSLEALVHLFSVEVGGDAWGPASLFSSWLLVSTRTWRVGLSACLTRLLVVRPVEGVACVAEIRQI